MKTIKVRIAIAVDRDGNWAAEGWGWLKNNCDDDAMGELVIDGVEFEGEPAVNFIEAEVPIPVFLDKETFKGHVVKKE